MLAYIEAFADRFNLRPLVRFTTRVVRLDHARHGKPNPERDEQCCAGSSGDGQTEESLQGRWTVVSQAADAAEQVRSSAAVYEL